MRRVRRVGELDCLQCALACIHGIPNDPTKPWFSHGIAATMRDAHVWLYWAGMTGVRP